MDVGYTGVVGTFSVGVMLYGVAHFGLEIAWFELLLNLFYIACLVMMGLYFFKRLKPDHFNYWSSVCVGLTVLLRDVLFAPELASKPIHLICLTLSVWLLMMLTYFYSRKEWKSYTKRTTTTFITWNPSMNTPTICSRKSGSAPPSPTDWWLALSLKNNLLTFGNNCYLCTNK